MGKKRNGGVRSKYKRGGYSEILDDEEPVGTAPVKVKSSKKGRKGRKHQHQAAATGNPKSDNAFRLNLLASSKTVIDMASDGNCLFRSISDQLYHDHGDKHEEIRNDVCDFMEANEDDFCGFLVLDDEGDEGHDAPNFDEYIEGIRQDGEWGGNLELVAAARLYQRNITVFSSAASYTIESGHERVSGNDLLVSYHENDHYNSVRDSTSKRTPYPVNTKHSFLMKQESNISKINGDATAGIDTKNEEPRSNGNDEPGRTSNSKGKQRKNDKCACGSGLRYKKCCLEVEKSQKRAQRWKEEHGNGTISDNDHSIEREEATDAFNLLKI